ncbi:hypothetical protein MES5069_60065 [Mesorhizobium escarrei]|uniref:Uncharacterized protein n=1 Tax=Mesorhizobium escarrei TaxID=666018 RepID=A0ABN8KCW0_9HYPH|nr:hypothetical protein MES5069_60065 [Mesorhizobium escarrei]
MGCRRGDHAAGRDRRSDHRAAFGHRGRGQLSCQLRPYGRTHRPPGRRGVERQWQGRLTLELGDSQAAEHKETASGNDPDAVLLRTVFVGGETAGPPHMPPTLDSLGGRMVRTR